MPGSDGVYSILEGGAQSDDMAFARAYQAAREVKRKNGTLAPAPLGSVNVAVLDSGVVAAGDDYFGDRVAGSFDVQGGVGVKLTKGLPATEGQHGAHVASIAASGTSMIKILDIQVGRTQEGGRVDLPVWHSAFKLAIEQRARVVNISVVCPWKDPVIKGMVANSTGTLFLATSGNAAIEFSQQYRTECGFDHGNVILVGGCNRDGSKNAQRGFGAGIDIFVPSMNVPGVVAKQFARDRELKRAQKLYLEKRAKIEDDKFARSALEAQARGDKLKPNQLRDIKKQQGDLAALGAMPVGYDLQPMEHVVNDCGVSFGIPMVANVAAKMALIYANITPAEIISIMKATGEGCEAGRVMDPARCYGEALKLREAWVQRI